MGYPDALANVVANYRTFSGRASRFEFWSWYLTIIGVAVLCAALASYVGAGMVANLIAWVFTLFWLATLVPTIAVAVRRLHDTDRSGWWFVMTFVPYLGLLLLIFYCLPSHAEPNRHGPKPSRSGALPAGAVVADEL